ncbi:myosin-6-like [Sinocyclocheilus grahami]|uniref:myosin-6-like n=1 Tax=Sinocyclocheilus grahami TaxID=75366 RepID=UPI0007ACBAC9|nr:PREDICTED: myosin-6-like [Sinocyclocheilus grahami]
MDAVCQVVSVGRSLSDERQVEAEHEELDWDSFTTSIPLHQSSDSALRKLSEDLTQKNELVHKLQKEKEHLVELSQQAIEDLQCEEEKVNLLTKEKAKLKLQAEDLEYLLEQERKQRMDLEKSRRRLEGDGRNTMDNQTEMGKMRASLEEMIRR